MTDHGAEETEIPGMTLEELLALPVSVPLDDANRALSLRRSTGYALARSGRYPVPVLRAGRTYRVARAALLRVLGISPDTPAPTADTDNTAV
ncbi:integrase [Streptomyces sp. MP131-18]|uniref:integrase n=1 Tax=Streptomyces sp. MP131-18 TaxID=1857892 RepID=UPI0009D0643C|nr:integrase [Streptomyces sp. MP131-18]ONK13074.1 hypothetical protein STBA_38360 [Streptomyces sp. MP131-18]